MDLKALVNKWFDHWERGDFLNLPISENFKHTSPFGVIKGKDEYVSLIKENKDKFLGYQFKILDQIYDEQKACVRYRAIQGDFTLDVSEWYYMENDSIAEIIAHYHIGEIREDRKFSNQNG